MSDPIPPASAPPDSQLAAHAEAVTALKDWSNYLLVTSVAAMGWIAEDHTIADKYLLRWRWGAGLCLSLSITCGILTLALIPLVRERIPQQMKDWAAAQTPPDERSIYRIKPPFRLLWAFDSTTTSFLSLKWVCFPQHVLFMLGVACYFAAKFGIAPFRSLLSGL